MTAPNPGLLPGLSIILPCLDEAENLRDVVRYSTEAAEQCAVRHEIVIVDDGSTDETIAIAGELASHDPRVQLVVHASNRGYGEALRSGIAAARQPWVLMIDADLQLDIAELGNFLGPAASADFVIGRRILMQGSAGRRLGGAVWRRFVQSALDLPFRDIDCAYRLVRLDLLRSLDLHADGPLAGAELLVKSRAAGARIAEVQVHHRARVAGRHTGVGTRMTGGTLRELSRLRRATGQQPMSGARL
jgi:glycosyltransferase involved in cell wall biosynthesis